MVKNTIKSTVVALWASCFINSAHAQQDTIKLMFGDSEVNIHRQGTEMAGPWARYMARLLTVIDMKATWHYYPWTQQYDLLKANEEAICALGPGKTPERSKFMKFTAPIGFGGKYVLITQKNGVDLSPYHSLKEILNTTKLRTFASTNRTYGAYIDGLIDANALRTKGLNFRRLVQLLESNVVDFVIEEKSTANGLLVTEHGKLKAFDHFDDLDLKYPYFIACSEKVSDAMMARLDQGIAQIGLVEDQ